MANPFAKSRPTTNPYAIYKRADFVWHVVKTYKQPSSEAKDSYARWLVAAKSDHTFGSFEGGDTYAREIQHYGTLVAAEPEWAEAYGFGLDYPTPADYLADA